MGLGGKEWIVIILVVLLLFGGKKIPELMRGLGSGLNEFKKATREDNKTEETTSDKKEN
ncbi:sec-independent protein translocase protein TatA [Chishuiella changwenlii]|jgi:sec-independent protein translocase protein TatA|uniref:Sec-independent protein translocase protein TatA n=1 Tax=Chishuiella changwenlii TaxID=1434701 RepID=A0A1M6YVL1_9FLAO|nr:twin-arginine translocase TatA/TatE family subunit [Chishuiella changwenlii]GGE88021.1 Sec-independent protein translocase protein TatA [Chishuiella changwenlii]SHL22341.1 sec-independent protein translocase protein TatA [Chishuiella changwenlii]